MKDRRGRTGNHPDAQPHNRNPGQGTETDARARAGDPVMPASRLTIRELEVLELLSAGRTNNEIARALFIAPSTAKAHVTRILYKLGVESRTEAALLWTRRRSTED